MNQDQIQGQILELLRDGNRRSDRWLLNALNQAGQPLEKDSLYDLCRHMRQQGLLEVIEVEDLGRESLIIRVASAHPQYLDQDEIIKPVRDE